MCGNNAACAYQLLCAESGRSFGSSRDHDCKQDLSILCYFLNSSQIELNYFTECLPYTAHPSRVRHVTTRTPSSFPLLASHERVVFQTFSA